LEVAKGGELSVKGIWDKGDTYRVDHNGARGVGESIPGCLDMGMPFRGNHQWWRVREISS